MPSQLRQIVHAPEFPDGLEWLNTSQPLRLAELRGRVVLSEASAIRTIDPREGGWLRTLVGTGLFDFGDRDGSGEAALLQHPLGVAVLNGRVYVADTNNHRIRVADLAAGRVSTLDIRR